jgi:hypothetical protein
MTVVIFQPVIPFGLLVKPQDIELAPDLENGRHGDFFMAFYNCGGLNASWRR